MSCLINCEITHSTFGVTGNKWRLAAKATCTTMASSLSGGLVAIVMSYISSGGKVEILATINGVLGALVGVTGKLPLLIVDIKQTKLNFLTGHNKLLSIEYSG